jgi:hypothetical protein
MGIGVHHRAHEGGEGSRLGYDLYGAQGGDFGAFVAPQLGRIGPDHVVGVHVNAATFGFIPFGDVTEADLATLTDTEKARLERLNHYLSEGNGYFQIQATRPQTMAYGLTDAIRRYSEPNHNIVHWSDFERGGHFAAMEAPDLLVGDLRTFFGRVR